MTGGAASVRRTPARPVSASGRIWWILARYALVLLVAVLGAPLAAAAPASAHPLGNFTVNRYARLEPSLGQLHVRYVLDLAEVPTLADAPAIGADPRAYAAARADQVERALRVRVDGAPLRLRRGEVRLSQPPGEGALATTRVEFNLRAALPGAAGTAHRVEFADDGEPDRPGWREIAVLPRGGARVEGGAATGDVSDELRAYPPEREASPMDVRRVAFTVVLGPAGAPPPPLGESPTRPAADSSLAGLVAEPLRTPWALAFALAVAFGIGVGHAFGPGHGKTVMAAYLMGGGAGIRHAAGVGVAVSVMHTVSVVGLGVVLLSVGWAARPERVFPWLSLAAGLAVLAVGVGLCRRRFGAGHTHHHGHGNADHGAHGHGHGHAHPAPLSWRGLLALGGSGGLYPSPSALVLLLSAVTLGRTGVGLALVGAFSLGLAATLTGVGVLLVAGRDAVSRHRLTRPLLGWLPRVGALVLVALGALLTAQAALRVAPFI